MPELFGRQFTRAELLRRVGHLSQVGGIQRLICDDGPSRGVRLLEFRTGTGFRFQVAVERGMDIGQCDYRGASLAWLPPTGLAAPWYFEQQDRFGWLRTALGGLNNTCGLIHIGNPEEDDVTHYNFPARPRETYGVHDRAALLPGELISCSERWEGDACILEAVGRVTQAQAYGETLVLTRTYRALLGESRLFVDDMVENAGYLPVVHMLLYHINAGFPFVDEGAELIAPFATPPAVLFGDADPGDRAGYARFIAPQRGWVQQTFAHTMASRTDGIVPVGLINPALEIGLYVRYRRAQLPHYIEWRMMGEGQYAVGIEPCTNGFGREAARKRGELIMLQPGERRMYTLEIGVLDGATAIAAFRREVEGLVGGH
jgi:hypothetical protein